MNSCTNCGRIGEELRKCPTCDNLICYDCRGVHRCTPSRDAELARLRAENATLKVELATEKRAVEVLAARYCQDVACHSCVMVGNHQPALCGRIPEWARTQAATTGGTGE